MPRDRSLGRSPRNKIRSSDTKKNTRERILFLPSLNTSLKCKTAVYLCQKYHSVRSVNLQSSNFLKENCFYRRLLTTSECLYFAGIVSVALLLWCNGYYYVPGFLLFPSSFFIWREWPKLVSKTWYTVMTNCIETTRDEIDDFNPTVVVGQGFGGGVAVFCLLEKHYVKPTVLLAPMHAELNRQMVFDWHGPRRLPDKAKLVLAHGTKDTVVDIKDSQTLAQDRKRCRFHEIKNENHRLQSLVGGNQRTGVTSELSLVDLIAEVVAL